jgi:hypothetical protein
MAQILTKDTVANIVVILTDSNDDAVTGLVHTDVSVSYAKNAAVSFTAKALTAPDWVEVGSGVYKIAFTAAELDTLGSFTVKVTGAVIKQFVDVSSVVSASTAAASTSVPTCILTGVVRNADGTPKEGASVIAKILAQPLIVNNIVVTQGSISAKTNANGEFFLTATRLAQVDISISACNYRRTLTVPNDASADIFTDIP